MDRLTDFTAQIIEAHRTGTRFTPGPDMAVPETRDQAFAVQDAVAEALGPVGGFKVGGDLVAAPVMAPILYSAIRPSQAEIPVADRMGVELEIGFEVIAPIPQGTAPERMAAFLRPLPVIEIVDTRLVGPLAETAIGKLADNQINNGLVIGKPLDSWAGTDFGKVTARMTCGDEQVLDGMAEVPGGSALTAFAALAEHLGDHCGGLVPGQIVITGSLCGLLYYPAGTEVKALIEGLGEVAVSLV